MTRRPLPTRHYGEAEWYARTVVTIQQPPIPVTAVVLRVIAILGMGLSLGAVILLLVAAEWLWAGVSAAASIPFFGMMYIVERLIPQLPE